MPAKKKEPAAIPLASRLNHLLRKDNFVLQAHWIEQDGAMVCVGLEVWKDVAPQPDRISVAPLPGTEIRGLGGTDLRTIPLASVLDQLWRMQGASEVAYNEYLDEHPLPVDIPRDERFENKPRRVSPTDRAFFHQVAEVYLEAMRSPGRKRPTDAVARRFGVSASAATKWVRTAREMKLLPPTTPGKPSARVTQKTRRAK